MRKRRENSPPRKRRTTLTLPAESLNQAGRIARARNVNLSTVVAEALSEGLRLHAATERSQQVLDAYKTAFTGFTDDEISVLNGILLEPPERP